MKIFDNKLFTAFLLIVYVGSFVIYDAMLFWRFKVTSTFPLSIAVASGFKFGDIVTFLPSIFLSSYMINKFLIKEKSWLYIFNIGLIFQIIVNILYSTLGNIFSYIYL